MAKALDVQIGGSHYKKYKIQPAEYCHVNRLGNLESYAVKYVTRWRDKGGLEDIRKAIHCLELLIELELKEQKDEDYCPDCKQSMPCEHVG